MWLLPPPHPKSGWQPVILAMSISSIGGLILDKTVSNPNFEGMAVFTPVINGVGGNLVVIQASRMSTYLHYWLVPGALPEIEVSWTLCHLLLFSQCADHHGHTAMTATFIICYLSAALLQVMILLHVASLMVHWLWRRGLDPDNFSIPYLTALGDLLGTDFLCHPD
ncbi:solute carrier family 41 member 1-like [Parambassis ranga]|uniref:Solute carrier family 41 member n=1 Tax=Parambassis ranga TaxID=210632 RepID=A0A6P7IFP4_9TELE|nr:solute carrier family 41 member 1-like [Parambassis ranga]